MLPARLAMYEHLLLCRTKDLEKVNSGLDDDYLDKIKAHAHTHYVARISLKGVNLSSNVAKMRTFNFRDNKHHFYFAYYRQLLQETLYEQNN